jgi:hypothetical protein
MIFSKEKVKAFDYVIANNVKLKIVKIKIIEQKNNTAIVALVHPYLVSGLETGFFNTGLTCRFFQ